MAINYAALTTEIQTDPAALGYAPFVQAGSDQAVADILNFARDGATPCPVNNVAGAAVSVRNPSVTGMAIRSVLDDRDLPASPTAQQLAVLQVACGSGSIDLVSDAGVNLPMVGNLRRMLKNVGDAGYQGTRERFDALINKVGSRAEKLFGPGTVVTIADVARALGRG